jgi:uncharacterized membrane protein YbhN (UPF0104 family)
MDPPTVGGASRYRRASTINVTGVADESLSIEPGRRARHTAIKVGRTVLALAAVGVLVLIGRRNAADLSHVHLRLRPAWLALAVPLYAAGSLMLAVGWREILISFGHRLPVRVAVRIWWRAQLARYVPTGLAAIASRAALARQEGVPTALGAASMALELAALVGWACLVAAIGLPSSLLASPLRWVLGLAAGGGLVALPVVYPWAAGAFHRVPALATLAHTRGRRPALYAALGLYGAFTLAKTVAFVAFTAALVPIHARDAWLIAGTVQAASVIGIIGVTPAGIGVRETAMVGLLYRRLGTSDAAAVAVAWRAFEFAFELGWLGLGTAWRRPAAPTPEGYASN